MRVDVWSYYSVDRPPVKFHRIRRPFGAPTDNYSGSIAGLTSDVFGLRKPCRAASLPSSLRPTRSSQSARPNLTLSSARGHPCARVRKLSRTRIGLSLPLCPDHPLTSIKYLRFINWTP